MALTIRCELDIDVLALGARIMTRIHTSLAAEAASRAEAATTTPPGPCGPLVTIVSAVPGVRAAEGVRMLRGAGALAATILERPTCEEDNGA